MMSKTANKLYDKKINCKIVALGHLKQLNCPKAEEI